MVYCREPVHLIRQDEKQFIVFDVEWLKVDAVLGMALHHKEEKVVRFAVSKAVWSDDPGRKMSKVRGNETDGEFVVLLKWIEVEFAALHSLKVVKII